MVREQEGSAPKAWGDPSIGMDDAVAWQPDTVAVPTGPPSAPLIVTCSFTTGAVETFANSMEFVPETQTASACLAGLLDIWNAAPMEMSPAWALETTTLEANEA